MEEKNGNGKKMIYLHDPKIWKEGFIGVVCVYAHTDDYCISRSIIT